MSWYPRQRSYPPVPRSAALQCPSQSGIEVGHEGWIARRRGRRQSPYHEAAPSGEHIETITDQVPQPPLDQVADDGRPNRAGNRESGLRRHLHALSRPGRKVEDEGLRSDSDIAGAARQHGGEILASPQPGRRGQHSGSTSDQRESGRQAGAALGPTGRQDRAPGPGPHPETKAVRLGASAVVRLERALAHSGAPVELICRSIVRRRASG
jgi:hypothetical protein